MYFSTSENEFVILENMCLTTHWSLLINLYIVCPLCNYMTNFDMLHDRYECLTLTSFRTRKNVILVLSWRNISFCLFKHLSLINYPLVNLSRILICHLRNDIDVP